MKNSFIDVIASSVPCEVTVDCNAVMFLFVCFFPYLKNWRGTGRVQTRRKNAELEKIV